MTSTWIKASRCDSGACMEIRWQRSGRCDTGNCVEVACVEDRVLVRDSKRPELPPLSYPAEEWKRLVDDLVNDDHPEGCAPVLFGDGDGDYEEWHVMARPGEALMFTGDEWDAFIEAARDGEFDVDRLAA